MHSQVPEIDSAMALAAIEQYNLLTFNEVSARDGLGIFTPERLVSTWQWVVRAQGFAPDALQPNKAVAWEFMVQHGDTPP